MTHNTKKNLGPSTDLWPASHTQHASNLTLNSPYVRPESLFDANSSCVLVPEVTQGPYYVADEYVRFDLTEDQEGVPLWLDIELVDVNTCENVDAGTFVDIWAANATGGCFFVHDSPTAFSSDADVHILTFRCLLWCFIRW